MIAGPLRMLVGGVLFLLAASSIAGACTAGCNCGLLQASCDASGGTCTDGGCCKVGSCCRSTQSGQECSNISCGGDGCFEGPVAGVRQPSSWSGCSAVGTRAIGKAHFLPAALAVAWQAEVAVTTPVNIPIRITDIDYEVTDRAVIIRSYKVTNTGDRPIIALELLWDVNDGNTSLRIPQYRDNWIAPEAGILPGQTTVGIGSLFVRTATGIKAVSVSVAYVEYGDGERTGADAQAFYPVLRAGRDKIMAFYARIGWQLRASGVDGVRRALNALPANAGPAEKSAAARLSASLARGGIEGLSKELLRMPANNRN
jgi:hypothetical protein